MANPQLQPANDTLATARAAFARLQAEANRRRWAADPVIWVTERLKETVWSKQAAIMRSVRDNRLTAVHTCHAVGKSKVAALIACWWIDTHPPGEAFVVTTASTWKQVEVVLWRELRRAHAKGRLAGRTNRTEWLMPIPGTDGSLGEEQVAIGHRPADTDPTAFHGIHAPYVLVIFDEACGVPKMLWDAGDSLISNEDSRFLAIGNPDDPVSEFFEVCKAGSGWNVITVSAFDSPNFTDELLDPYIKKQLVSHVWVEEKKRRWGTSNPLYISKVLGQFPEFSEDTLIPMHWIRAAQARYVEFNTKPRGWAALGVDVGGGGDKNVIAAHYESGVVKIVHEDREPNTMRTKDRVLYWARSLNAVATNVDYIGIGRGAVDQIKREKIRSTKINGVEVGRPASDPDGFTNLRAEAYWHLRQLFQDDLIAIDPDDDELAAQLADLHYDTPGGRMQIESKDSMKRRGKSSPDRADAVMLACMPPPKKKTKATWGRKKNQPQPTRVERRH